MGIYGILWVFIVTVNRYNSRFNKFKFCYFLLRDSAFCNWFVVRHIEGVKPPRVHNSGHNYGQSIPQNKSSSNLKEIVLQSVFTAHFFYSAFTKNDSNEESNNLTQRGIQQQQGISATCKNDCSSPTTVQPEKVPIPYCSRVHGEEQHRPVADGRWKDRSGGGSDETGNIVYH